MLPFFSLLLRKAFAACLLMACFAVSAGAAEMKVVATIKPLQGLVAAVMQGAGEPQLLLPPTASPHSYSLRPSDRQAMETATLLFWVGPSYETFLVKPLRQLPASVRVVALSESPGLELLPLRGQDEAQEGHGDEVASGSGAMDMHIWLDPQNAKTMIMAIANALSRADPARGDLYYNNAMVLQPRLDALVKDVEASTAPVRQAPFLLFHDGYQYFERRFQLNGRGALALHPEQPVSAQRMMTLRSRIREEKIGCVFAEPQFSPRMVETLTDGLEVRTGTLDYMGAGIAAGPEMYFTLLRHLGENTRKCLGNPQP